MTKLNTNHGNIEYFYREAVADNQPTFVFLPAFGGDNTYFNFKHLIDQLDEKWGALTIDPLGYGKSDTTTSPRTWINIIDELHQVISSLDPQMMIMVGHGFGGSYAAAYSVKFPQHIIANILIEPTTFRNLQDYPETIANFIKTAPLAAKLKANGLARELELQANINPFLDEEDQEENKQLMFEKLANLTLVDEAQMALANTSAIETLLEHVANDSRVPTLLFTRYDRLEELEASAYLSNVPNSQVIVLEGMHYLHWSQPEAILEWTNSFVADVLNDLDDQDAIEDQENA